MLKQILVIVSLLLLVGCQIQVTETSEDSSEVKEVSEVLDNLDKIDALGEELVEDLTLNELENLTLG